MKKREFNKILKECSNEKGFLDLEKIKKLPDVIKESCGLFIVKHREPVLKEFGDYVDKEILYGYGYLRISTNKSGYTFYHTSEHKIL